MGAQTNPVGRDYLPGRRRFMRSAWTSAAGW